MSSGSGSWGRGGGIEATLDSICPITWEGYSLTPQGCSLALTVKEFLIKDASFALYPHYNSRGDTLGSQVLFLN